MAELGDRYNESEARFAAAEQGRAVDVTPRLEVFLEGRGDHPDRKIVIFLGSIESDRLPLITALRLRVTGDDGDLLCFPFQIEGGPPFFVKWRPEGGGDL